MKKKFYFSLFWLLCTCAFIIGLNWLGFFSIKNVRCVIEADPCPELVTTLLQTSLRNQSILFSKLDQEIPNILATTDSYELESYTTTNIHTLSVRLKNHPSTYQLKLGDEVYQISNQGSVAADQVKIISTTPTITLAPAFADQVISDDKVQEPYHSFFINVASWFYNSDFTDASIEALSETQMLIRLDDSRHAIIDMTATEETVIALKALQSSDLEAETETRIQEIDLRFKLPVLRSEKTVSGNS